ncbi:toll-like receptor 10 isoform X1 [Ptychodera flava]|uniref:toll-like receptor 10 isoform X1 n=1 Tax=Ptychodera flava TaxID=63121 RepID=UPI00396A903C
MAETSISDETVTSTIQSDTLLSGANRSEISESNQQPKRTIAEDLRRDSVDELRQSAKIASRVESDSGIRKQTIQVTDKETANNDVAPTECDLFFSYSSKDKGWVFETAERLERDHDIVCSYDSKDFIGGKAITSNIMNCIKMSRKTVLMLSPDFLRSPWCEYEMQIVLREHLFRERKVVIPVLLHDCIIPDFISHLTYLEVKDPQFWEKFLELIKSESADIEGLSEVFSFGHEADKFNGQIIARASTGFCCSSKFNSSHLYET